MRAFALAFVFAVTTVTGLCQTSDPMQSAALLIGANGMKPGKSAGRGATIFTPSADRSALDAFIDASASNEAGRRAMKELVDSVVSGYEESAKAAKMENDAAGALAVATLTAYSVATGKEVKDELLPIFAAQIRAAMETPEVKATSNKNKQAFYHRCLATTALIVSLAATAGEDEEKKTQVRQAADKILLSLIGTKSDAITISSSGVTIKPAPGAQASKSADGLARGFKFTPPAGCEQNAGWTVKKVTKRDNNNVTQVTSALIRLLPAMPASGTPGEALRKLWTTAIPAEFAKSAGPVVFVRYIGNGMRAYFIFGTGREKGRSNETLFSLFLAEVGDQWQPFVVAQTYDEIGAFTTTGLDMATRFSLGDSAREADAMLAAMSGPAGPDAILDPKWIAGNYEETSGGYQEWMDADTGASLPSTFVSRSFSLNLRGDNTYDFRFSGASGTLGNTTFSGQTDSGTWSLVRDRLILKAKQLRLEYLVAGVSTLKDGRKVLLMFAISGDSWPAVTASNVGRFTTFVQKR